MWENEVRTEIVTSGSGKVRSYDLDGKRRWITRLPIKQLSYTSSPALNSGMICLPGRWRSRLRF